MAEFVQTYCTPGLFILRFVNSHFPDQIDVSLCFEFCLTGLLLSFDKFANLFEVADWFICSVDYTLLWKTHSPIPFLYMPCLLVKNSSPPLLIFLAALLSLHSPFRPIAFSSHGAHV